MRWRVWVVTLLALAACGSPASRSETAEDGPDTLPTASDRRIAIPLDSVPAGLRACGAFSLPAEDETSSDKLVVYGERARADPFEGPMLAVMSGGNSNDGDGDRTLVRVRGIDGVAAPITVFQQNIPEGLGTVIAWRERDIEVGLYGRLWDASRVGELVAIADRLEFADGHFRLPADSLPDGYAPVGEGRSVQSLALVEPHADTYTASYDPTGQAEGTLAVSARSSSAFEFAALRFFGRGLAPMKLDGRDALVGNAWTDSGPAVVAWRESDGLVVRLVGLGVVLDRVKAAAAATRELSSDEWTKLTEQKCEDRLP